MVFFGEQHFARQHFARLGGQLVLVGALMVALAGCPGAGVTPSMRLATAVAVYDRALEAGDFVRAHGMLSTEIRRRYPMAEFIRIMKARPRVTPPAPAKRRADKPKPARVHAKVTVEGGRAIELVLHKATWRFSQDPTLFYDQGTPRAALRSFIRAIENRRPKVLLRFVPQRLRPSLDVSKIRRMWQGEKKAETEAMLLGLKAGIESKILMGTQGRATMPYGDGKSVRFLLEDGVWKIEDSD